MFKGGSVQTSPAPYGENILADPVGWKRRGAPGRLALRNSVSLPVLFGSYIFQATINASHEVDEKMPAVPPVL